VIKTLISDRQQSTKEEIFCAALVDQANTAHDNALCLGPLIIIGSQRIFLRVDERGLVMVKEVSLRIVESTNIDKYPVSFLYRGQVASSLDRALHPYEP
jgi:hypothetical protein